MRSQNQYTIYSLNDVVTSATAPSNPYKGQLWVNTSKSPPVTMVYNGSAWKEQNGTDTMRSNISTVTEKANTLETNLSGLTSTVSENTKTIETLSTGLGEATSDITNLESSVSSLQQTATTLSANVAKKVDNAYGSSSSSFGWSLKSSGFYVYSNASTVVKITSGGLEVKGKITADSGTIGGFTVQSNSLDAGTWGEDNSVMLCTGTSTAKSVGGSESISGWAITAGSKFGVTTSGDLYASNAYISGKINATSGYMDNVEIGSNCYIYGYVYMSGSESVKFYGTKMTMNYETWLGGTGFASTITYQPKSSSTIYTSYSYIRPFGMTIVPNNYATYADDGMIFGIMQSYSFKTQSLLCGVSFYYANDGTNFTSELLMRCADKSCLDVIYTTSGGWYAAWGVSLGYNYFVGCWYPYGCTSSFISTYYSGVNATGGMIAGAWYLNGSTIGKLYAGTNAYIAPVTINSTVYGCLYSNWYAAGQIMFGTSTTGYHLRIDSDQVTWYYGTTQVGEIESYTSYVDIQGTFKTNGNAWISSSDIKVKNTIEDYPDEYETLFDNLKPRRFKYNKGTSNRKHCGFIVQEVREAMSAASVPASDFAVVCAFGDPDDDATEWGLRYEELIPLNTWEIQKLKRRVKELEEILKETEEDNETESNS